MKDTKTIRKHDFEGGNMLVMRRDSFNFSRESSLDLIQVTYLDRTGEKSYDACHSQYFLPEDIKAAELAYKDRLASIPSQPSNSDEVISASNRARDKIKQTKNETAEPNLF